MKTFKIAGFFLSEPDYSREIELIDGLIINRENEQRSWLIELYVDYQYEDLFKACQRQGEEINVQLLISHRDNDPATFTAKMREMNKLDRGINVLLEGRLQKMRNLYAKQVLERLVSKGLEGDALIDAFHTQLTRRRNIPSPKKE
ncbi:YwpF family protein [Bacillus xiapuensis]|uniref:YwpF family protein n=1 Tax=Bacillus xiapuensis TaxID=2014075 RepID=UPI0012FD6AF2|nr:YwpF family protein [Bacillus xiapuensis]